MRTEKKFNADDKKEEELERPRSESQLLRETVGSRATENRLQN